ncbi:MAG: hypothetical protein HC780_25790, partial [Leptolyngbyaceae cyanobacterium CSU_1_3]|nr:hypothetical protein [Leptolyngbyaceae cyanobacterium CSU_1_3]
MSQIIQTRTGLSAAGIPESIENGGGAIGRVWGVGCGVWGVGFELLYVRW